MRVHKILKHLSDELHLEYVKSLPRNVSFYTWSSRMDSVGAFFETTPYNYLNNEENLMTTTAEFNHENC